MFDFTNYALWLAIGGAFLCALLLGLVLTPLCAGLARRLNMLDTPGVRKIHEKVTPYGGGLAVWLGIFLTLLAGYTAVTLRHVLLPAALLPLVENNIGGLTDPSVLRKLLGIFLGSSMVFCLGLVDDARPLPAKLKLCVQILAALILWYCGVRITFFIESALISLLLTVGWVVVITNAFNLLDNMDGLSPGVALLAGLHLLLIAALTGHIFIAVFLGIFCGSVAGFLRYNFPPARLFMGDAGSLFTGFMLASICAAATFCNDIGSAHTLLIPALALGVPLFDTASVILIRLHRGASIFVGDTNHLSHRLVRMGFSRRNAVLLIYLLGFIFGQCAVLLRKLDTLAAVFCFIIALAVTALMALLMSAHLRESADPIRPSDSQVQK